MNYTEKGFTLIEILTVTAILVVVSTIISGVVYTTLRATNKTRITSAVAQNGSYALSIISNIVISSTNVTQVNGTSVSNCTTSPSGTSITLSRIDGGSTTLACTNVNGIYTIASNGASLIDNNIVQIKNGSCTITCMQPSNNSYATPLIQVAFTVGDKGTTPAFENIASSDFNTSITMRSFNP